MNAPPRFARQHRRLSWKVRTTELCGVPWWQDRVPGGSSRSEIKLRSGDGARVVACDMDMLAGMDEQYCWRCVWDERTCGLRVEISW